MIRVPGPCIVQEMGMFIRLIWIGLQLREFALTIFSVHPLSVLQQELRYSPVPFHLVMGYRIGCLAVTFRLT